MTNRAPDPAQIITLIVKTVQGFDLTRKWRLRHDCTVHQRDNVLLLWWLGTGEKKPRRAASRRQTVIEVLSGFGPAGLHAE